MRLIDADELFKAFENAKWYDNNDRDLVAEDILLDAPTVCKMQEEEFENALNWAVKNSIKWVRACEFPFEMTAVDEIDLDYLFRLYISHLPTSDQKGVTK